MLILFPQTSNFRIKKLCYVFKNKEAVIKMIIKGRSPYNEACFQDPQSCSCLAIQSNQYGPKIQIKDIDTKHQLADMLTKGNFTFHAWNHLLCLFKTLAISVPQIVLKCCQKERKKNQVKRESQQSQDQ